MQSPRFASLSFVALAALSTTLPAQVLRGGRGDTVSVAGDPTHHTPSEFALRSSGSITGIQMRPQGGLSRNIGFGYGGHANYVFRIDDVGVLGLRAGFSYSAYGNETKTVPLSPTIGGRVLTDVNTYNTIGALTIGPQLMFPVGYLRPYVNVGVGVLWFETTSSVSGVDGTGDEQEFATRNYSDGTPTWSVGTGVHIPLEGRHSHFLLDVGAEYFYGGEASYLRPGSIVDLPNSQIQINPFRSETRFVNVNLGLRITP